MVSKSNAVKDQRLVVLITPEDKADLEKIKAKTGASIGEIVRRAIEAYVKKQ